MNNTDPFNRKCNSAEKDG